jgi:hypothetical protein
MRALPLFGVLVLMFACSSKKDAPGGGGPAPTAAPGGPAATAVERALDCDRVLAKEVRAKYFAGATFTNVPQPIASAGECKITMGEDDVRVSVTCHDNMAASMAMSIDNLKKNLGAKDLPGVGRGAVTVDMGAAGVHVTAWDDDSNCSISVGVPKAIDPTAFAKDLLGTLPPK